jgi:hypothetical protein
MAPAAVQDGIFPGLDDGEFERDRGATTLRAPENILRRASSGLPALADGGLPRLGRMRTGYSACSDSFATEPPIVELQPIHVLTE